MQVLSCEFCEISKNTFFHTIPLVVASEIYTRSVKLPTIKEKVCLLGSVFSVFYIRSEAATGGVLLKTALKNFCKIDRKHLCEVRVYF